jgi:hypothetical protein
LLSAKWRPDIRSQLVATLFLLYTSQFTLLISATVPCICSRTLTYSWGYHAASTANFSRLCWDMRIILHGKLQSVQYVTVLFNSKIKLRKKLRGKKSLLYLTALSQQHTLHYLSSNEKILVNESESTWKTFLP